MQDRKRDTRHKDNPRLRKDTHRVVGRKKPASRRAAAPVVEAALANSIRRHGVDANEVFLVAGDVRHIEVLFRGHGKESLGQRIEADARAVADTAGSAQLSGAVDRRVESIARETDSESELRFPPDLCHDLANGKQLKLHGFRSMRARHCVGHHTSQSPSGFESSSSRVWTN